MKKLPLQTLVLFVLLASGCKDQVDIHPEPHTLEHSTKKEVLIDQFAKTLALTLQKIEIRQFLKTEALKQFDGDYDILFSMIKDHPIDDAGNTLISVLQKYNEGRVSISEISSQIPLLNISIPDLMMAHPEDWDVENHIPVVTVYNNSNPAECLKSYNYKDSVLYINAIDEPFETVIVVSENERVTCTQDGLKSTRMSLKDSRFLFKDGEHNYYLDEIEDLSIDCISPCQSPSPLKSASASSPREILYYKSGEMNYNMFETLTYFRFTSGNAVKVASDSWAEGELEIECTIIVGGTVPEAFQPLFGKKSVSKSLALLTACQSLNEYLSCHKLTSGFYGPIMKKILTEQYKRFYALTNVPKSSDGKRFLSFNWKPFSWSPHKYGDAIQVIFKEFDLTKDHEETITHSVTFNSSIGSGKKDIYNLGLNTTVSGKTIVSYQTGSDALGNCYMLYYEDFGLESYRSLGDVEFVLQPLY